MSNNSNYQKQKPETEPAAKEATAQIPEPVKTVPETKAGATDDWMYPVTELAAKARKLFDVTPECVTTALKLAGLKMATMEKAKETVEKFMKQEVN